MASADDALIDAGPVVSVAAGDGRLVWARSEPAGVVLVTHEPDGDARTLPPAPVRSLRALDVGADRSGRATATYIICRSERSCGVRSVRLDGGSQRAVPVPQPPRGCTYDAAVRDRALYLGLTGCKSRGIYRLRGRRLVPVVRGRVLAFDIAEGRLAYAHPTPPDELTGVQVTARRLASAAGRVMIVDEGPSVGNYVRHTPQRVGRRLWIGVYYENSQGSGVAVRRCTFPARNCQDADGAPHDPSVTGWGLSADASTTRSTASATMRRFAGGQTRYHTGAGRLAARRPERRDVRSAETHASGGDTKSR